jgi:hypothetical protein
MVSTASGGWENYHLAGKHMHIANLILNNFRNIVNFFDSFLVGLEFSLIGCHVIESILHVYRKSWEVSVEK